MFKDFGSYADSWKSAVVDDCNVHNEIRLYSCNAFRVKKKQPLSVLKWIECCSCLESFIKFVSRIKQIPDIEEMYEIDEATLFWNKD